ncbi:hypothetical protein [Methylocaldum szegediense]|uniref:hypothetical protein n=1 Tax=Methylocaldum szegediense TaxID=73780 RepID=UPI0004065D57|nr:hypothetical protein [Methylocaldum szegediense]
MTNAIKVIVRGIQGPPGVQGPPGPAGGSALQYTAGEALGGHRMVVLNAQQKAIYADSSDPTHVDKVLGLTLGAAAQDALVTVQNSGEISEPSWNWALNQPVFLGTQGQLTQTPPATGFVLMVGFPTSSNTLFLDIKQAILR